MQAHPHPLPHLKSTPKSVSVSHRIASHLISSQHATPAHARNAGGRQRLQQHPHRAEQQSPRHQLGRSSSVCVPRASLLPPPSKPLSPPPSLASQPSIHLPIHPAQSRIESRRVQTTHRECQTPGCETPNQQAASPRRTQNCSLPIFVASARATICRVSFVVQSSVQIPLPRILSPVPRHASCSARTHAREHAAAVSELSGTPASHLLLPCILASKPDLSLLLTVDKTSQPADA